MTFNRTVLFRGGILVLAALAASCSQDPETLKRKYLASGDAYMAQEKVDEAIIEYRNATQQDGRSGEARYKLAAAYVRAGNGSRALGEAVRAADLLPEDEDAQLQATNLLILSGRFADAQDRANKLLARDPHNVRATVALGNALAGLRDLNGAVAQMEEAIRLDPTRTGSYTNLATLQLGAGKIKEAEAAYLQAVEKAPDSMPSRLALAQFYWLTSRPLEAEPQLLQALRTSPHDVVVNRFAAAFYQATGQPGKAEQYFRAAVDADGSAKARLSLAEYYIAGSRLPEATAVLQALVSGKDKEVGTIAKVRLATIDYSAGRVPEAVKAIDDLLKTQPRHFEALLVKASMLFDQRRLDDALARTNDAIKSNPVSAPAYFAKGRVLAAANRWDEAKEAFNETLRLNPRASGAQIELSKIHLQTGATDTAVELAGTAVRLDPQRADARLVLARGLIIRGELIQAEAVLKELVAALPNSAVVRAQVGWLKLVKKDTTGASAEFQRALQLDPVQLDAVSGLVALDLAAGRQAEARSRIQAVVDRAPKDAALLTLAGRTNLMTGKFIDAEKMLTRAIEADPSSLEAYSHLGQVYLQQGRTEDARHEFERRAQHETRPVAALTMVGLIDQMQNRTEDAKRVFEQVLALDPKASVAANNLAWIYSENGGNLDVALQLAQTARAALPDSAETSDTLGWVYLKKEIYGLSITTLRRAVELAPKNPTFHYHLGLAYARSGDKDRARATLQAALRLDTAFDGAPDAKRVLAGL